MSKVQRLVNLENQKQVRGVGVVFVAVGGCGGVGLVDDERMNASFYGAKQTPLTPVRLTAIKIIAITIQHSKKEAAHRSPAHTPKLTTVTHTVPISCCHITGARSK